MAQNFNDLYGQYGLKVGKNQAGRLVIQDSGEYSGRGSLREVTDADNFYSQFGQDYNDILTSNTSGTNVAWQQIIAPAQSGYQNKQAFQLAEQQANQFNQQLQTAPVGTQVQLQGSAPVTVGQGGSAISTPPVNTAGMIEIAPGQFVPQDSPAARMQSGTLTPAEQAQLAPKPTAQSLAQSGVLNSSSNAQLNQKAQAATNLNEFYTALGTTLPSLAQRAIDFERLTGEKGYTGTAAQNKRLLDIQKQLNSMGTGASSPSVGGTIDASTLGQSGGVDVGSPSATMSYGALGQGNQSLFQSLFDSAIKQTETDLDAIDKAIQSQISRSDSASDLRQAEEQLKVSEKRKALEDLQTEMADLEAAYRAQSEYTRNQAIPTAFIIGQQNEADRTYALKSTAVATRALLAQGNLDYAEEKAKEYVELKYRDEQQKLDLLKYQAEVNRDKLDRLDKKKTEELSLYLSLRQEALDAQKEEDSKIWSLASEAAANGAPQDVINRISKAKTSQEAMQIAGSYIGKLDREQQAFTNALAQQRANEAGVASAELLSPTEAALFGLPFGATEADAAGLYAISPEKRLELAEFTNAHTIVNQIDELSKKVLSGEEQNIFGTIKQNTSLKYGAATKQNPDAVLFESKRGVMSSLIRSLGEKGALNEGDIQRAVKALPTFGDSYPTAKNKLDALREIFNNAEAAKRASLTTPVGMFSPNTQQTTPPKTTPGGVIINPVDELRAKYGY